MHVTISKTSTSQWSIMLLCRCSPCTQLLLKTPEPLCPICRSIVQSFILKEFDV